jgi:hypothetical protein
MTIPFHLVLRKHAANRQDVLAALCSTRQAKEKLYKYEYFKSHPKALDMWLTQSHFWILLCDYYVGRRLSPTEPITLQSCR